MTEPLKVIPSTDDVKTGVTGAEAVSAAIRDLLSDTYMLIFKTHSIHWNVEGPLFYAVHNLTEEQYEDLFQAADDLAERIRALGHMAPSTFDKVISDSVVEDAKSAMSAGEMCQTLAEDHERVAARMHALAKIAGDNRDVVTEDLATQRSAFHEKAAWMLRAIAKD